MDRGGCRGMAIFLGDWAGHSRYIAGRRGAQAVRLPRRGDACAAGEPIRPLPGALHALLGHRGALTASGKSLV